MWNLINYISSLLYLLFLFILVKFLNRIWWAPIRIQSMMRKQGIQGPPYRFLHGNIKEVSNMRKAATSIPMEFSHDMLPRILPHIYSWRKLYGTNFLYWYGTQAQLVITEPELVKEILNNKDETYCKTLTQEHTKKLLGDGLLLSRGEKWMKIRKLANHAFHAEELKTNLIQHYLKEKMALLVRNEVLSLQNMVPSMVKYIETMIERWRHHEGKEIEVFHEFKVVTSEIISRTAFGSSYMEGEKIFDMVRRMGHIIGRNRFKAGNPWIRKLFKASDDFESDKLQQEIREAIINIVKKREQAMKPEKDGPENDFLGLLVKAYNDPDMSNGITLDDLIDECKTFYVAGQETTTSALSWTVLLLAIHSDWQGKARNEVLQLFGQENPTVDGLARMKTMSMIINESLRLFSPAVNLTRKTQKEGRLGKLIIPANMEIDIPTLALHHDPRTWGDDVELFKPERFAEGVAKATNGNISAFLPFGLGTRICVGLNFATTEMKIALSMILQRYKFTLSHNYIHSPVQFITVCPQHGLQIMLKAL